MSGRDAAGSQEITPGQGSVPDAVVVTSIIVTFSHNVHLFPQSRRSIRRADPTCHSQASPRVPPRASAHIRDVLAAPNSDISC